jgi:YgiT-type zinc finger domain-containing protein
MITKKGELDLRVAGRLFIVKNVQYDECPSCGEKVLSPNVSQKLYEKIKDKQYIEENFLLPVLDGTYG